MTMKVVGQSIVIKCAEYQMTLMLQSDEQVSSSQENALICLWKCENANNWLNQSDHEVTKILIYSNQ